MDTLLISLPEAVKRTMAYADVFDYPLTAPEIQRYLIGYAASLETINSFLQEAPALYPQMDGFYTLPGRTGLVEVRKQRAQNSLALRKHAWRYAKIMQQLPFIRMVALTGSLAVDNVTHGADIDYLIVTQGGRLWLARALVLLLGRFSRLQRVTLCPNYLITLRALYFNDQTFYTAHELAHMVPLVGLDTYTEIRRQNSWVTRFLPNAGGPPPGASECKPLSAALLRRAGETILSTPPADWVERWEMQRKIQKLKRQQSASQEVLFSADVCKGHDQRHQARTQSAWRDRLRGLEKI